jgi:SNF2 family DNA or RNA helicase
MSLLQDTTWKTKYDSDGASLVREFYEPAVACAVRYDRTTGYFSSGVLALASRGVEGLIRNGGRMRLVVGCTLGAADVEAIYRGQSLRDTVSGRLLAMPLTAGSAGEEAALEFVSWMVARGLLEVRVAVPCDAHRRPVASTVLFHEKAGVVEDKTGDRLAFNGSVNETPQGWAGNWESFHVFTSWSGEDGRKRVEDEEEGFARLWNDKVRHCLVIDVPTAVREDLLRFLPEGDAAPQRLKGDGEAPPETEPPEAEPPALSPEVATDLRPLVWGIIRHAPELPGGGERVGEATANVVPWPHQVRAFDRLYRNWPPRLLIADEVGLGKTIEAGLLLRQAWLAGRARRILILAPKAILTQWQIELREKFNLSWPIYDGQKLSWYPSPARRHDAERKVGRNEWQLEPCVITSSQLMRRVDRAGELLEQALPWDLVVLDEAHHARRKGAGLTKDRKPNQLLSLMQRLRPRTQGLLLLTATPMQVSPVEVWDLLNLLELPPEWDEASFLWFFDKVVANPSHEEFETLARLFRAAEARFGPLDRDAIARFVPGGSGLAAKKILQALRDAAQTERRRLETDRRRAALRVMQAASPVRQLISRHTRELLRRYYEAGRISTRVPSRDVRDIFVELSREERGLYEQVEEYISTTYNQAKPDEKNAVGFIMTVYRRRLASSFEALCQTLSGRLGRLQEPGKNADVSEEDILDDETADEVLDAEDAAQLDRQALLAEEKGVIANLLEQAQALPPDTKLGALIDALRRLQSDGYQQVLVFTQYTDTLDFIRERLVGEGFRVMCFSGRGGEVLGKDSYWRTIGRDDVKRTFRKGDSDILCCTDAAAEGLNFQFCGALVNYDMPWNPMRVEQRIGRIDRLGQRFKEIRVVNLHYEDTVETDVYRALRERIGLFTRFVGKLQPILSALPKGIAETAFKRPKEERIRQRAELVSRIEGEIAEKERVGFDLDAITEADLEEPVRPEPLYSLDELDALVRRKDLLPPGVEVRHLALGEYEFSAPGMGEPIRVTTRRDFYEEHAGSVELWSPGSLVFPAPDDVASAEDVSACGGRLRRVIERES